MGEQASLQTKTFSFGGCDFTRTLPPLGALSPDTKFLNIEIPFEEALKLHLAIWECISRLNSYKRNTRTGRRTALNLAIHLSKNRITINETKLLATQAEPSDNGIEG